MYVGSITALILTLNTRVCVWAWWPPGVNAIVAV